MNPHADHCAKGKFSYALPCSCDPLEDWEIELLTGKVSPPRTQINERIAVLDASLSDNLMTIGELVVMGEDASGFVEAVKIIRAQIGELHDVLRML